MTRFELNLFGKKLSKVKSDKPATSQRRAGREADR